ncbi:MAG: metal-dependent transcriptional regulator [Nanoarchaeota archaeon]|nr:metal-dependent transcriptional regulator [Nanoarchaeota archaeon]
MPGIYHPNRLHWEQKDNITTEMYLKTIFLYAESNNRDPRPVDIVNELDLSKGTVSEMLKKLSGDRLIEYHSYGKIKLTTIGQKKAENVVRKYLVLKRFLVDILGVSPAKAHNEACGLEHVFSDDSIKKLGTFLNKTRQKNK